MLLKLMFSMIKKLIFKHKNTRSLNCEEIIKEAKHILRDDPHNYNKINFKWV